MKIAVTGSTGFLGAALVPLLKEQGNDVIGISRHGEHAIDLSEKDSIPKLTSLLQETEVVIHLAAAIPGKDPASQTEDAMRRANVDATKHLLQSLGPVTRYVLFASTLDVYGIPEQSPITESCPLRPLTAYAKAKVEAEALVQSHCDAHGIPWSILRFTQLYGPGDPPLKLIPMVIHDLLAKRPMTLMGDGSDKRDYVYRDDATEAIVKAVEQRAEGIIDIASGKSVLIGKVFSLLREISGSTQDIIMKDRTKPKIDFVFDISRMRELLHWEPTTSLEDGLRITYHSLRTDSL